MSYGATGRLTASAPGKAGHQNKSNIAYHLLEGRPFDTSSVMTDTSSEDFDKVIFVSYFVSTYFDRRRPPSHNFSFCGKDHF